jgi:hypothetical protein
MTTDPFGADAPLGDDPEEARKPRQEDLLGLEAEFAGAFEEEVSTDEGALEGAEGALEAPTEEDFRSALPGVDAELEAAFGDFADEDGSTSWLMEFDLDDEGFDPEEALERALQDVEDEEAAPLRLWIGRALLAAVSVAAGVVGAKLFLDPGPAATPEELARRTPQAPAAPGTGTPATEGAPAAPATGGAPVVSTNTPAPEAGSDVAPSSTGTAPEPAPVPAPAEPGVDDPGQLAGEPSAPGPAVAAEPAPPAEEPGVPTIQIDWGDGASAAPAPPVAAAPEDPAPTAPVEEGGLREASPEELAAVWSGAAIPVEALRGAERVMTPGVGRVRVVLARGEVFEGRLYAVGQRKLWLETELGRMALLDWQVDRIEHIVAADGTPLSGGDSARDLAGLPGVRVRTAGGVFYGKLLSRDGDSVVIVTDSGGRVTLSGAEVELAGKATTHVIDANGAAPAVVGEAAAAADDRR